MSVEVLTKIEVCVHVCVCQRQGRTPQSNGEQAVTVELSHIPAFVPVVATLEG